MSDLISRQAAIDAVRDRMGKGETHIGDTFIECFEMMLNALPSAQPEPLTEEEKRLLKKLRSYHNGSYAKILDKLVASAQPEQQWIPCSERLPEEDYCTGRGIQHSESVLVTIVHHANDDDVFVDMACTVDGKWQLTYPIDDDPDIPKWCEIIAWMPLPESYKGE